ncbi:MAG: terpene cyclase/mutase family protein [Abditibacteriales bacterium]|nr:terpene cyclase/mutase family protein [Abditibacteriales bacterium]MDW8364864.1 terpene cyclase/mutase family protein [Abditibacteriales bacterium]
MNGVWTWRGKSKKTALQVANCKFQISNLQGLSLLHLCILASLCLLLLLPAVGFARQKREKEVEEREYLGTPESERAVERALAFLAARQSADGRWVSAQYTSECGITALCLLAFLSAGHQPDRGKYGKVVSKAVDYLLRNVQENGLIYDTSGRAGPPMYGHGFATLALAEVYGMTKRTDVKEKLERAVRLILACQNSEGGWRYQPRVADADISVVICQVMALRAAHNAGIIVPPETVKKAIEFVKRCANNPDGGFSYMPYRPGSGVARTGAGVLSLIVCGEPTAEQVKNGLEYLLRSAPDVRGQHHFYALYYCTQAMYQAGGKYWLYWYPRVRDYLVKTQSAEGSWYDAPGEAYATAMGVLALQVPAALLPIYQK